MQKVCTQCGIAKPISEFGKASTCVDGTRSYCKACHKGRKDAWRLKNRDAHNTKCRDWAASNREVYLETKKRHNRKRAASGAQLESERAWRKNNPGKAREHVAYRRSKIKSATPPWVDRAALLHVYNEATRLGLVVDHIVPIVHDAVCGLHVPWNLQLMTKSENSAKGNRFVVV